MVHLHLILLISLASNLDNLGVGLAYGVRHIRIPVLPNLLIAGLGLAATYVSVWAGGLVAQFLPVHLANVIGAVMIIGVGLWVMKPKTPTPSQPPETPSVLGLLDEPEQADQDRSGVISLKESVWLGVALALNNVTNGFSAGLWSLGAFPTALGSGLFSYLTLWGGALIGSRYAAQWLGEKASVVAGLLLILIGVRQLL